MRPFIALHSNYLCDPNQSFVIEKVPLIQLLSYGHSPLYVTSLSAVEFRIKSYLSALQKHFPKGEIYYAVKANFAPPILNAVRHAGGRADIVSQGEWKAALQSGFHPHEICFAGVGKTRKEISLALSAGVGAINVEHVSELDFVLEECRENKYGERSLVAIRLNPCIEIDTHPHLKTGARDSKFGVLIDDIKDYVTQKRKSFSSEAEWLEFTKPLRGLHVHIGSQLLDKSVFRIVIEKVLSAAQFLADAGISIESLDLGGGLGVAFEGVPENNSDIENHVDFLSVTLQQEALNFPELIKKWGTHCEKLHVSLEPGRSVVASATVFLTKVLYEKNNFGEHHFAYVDGAMNDFPRPTIYGAKHQVATVFAKNDEPQVKNLYKIAGPVCESGDILATNVLLSKLKEGDILGFFDAGAYCRSMASHYNLRPLPAEIFIKSGKIVAVYPPQDYINPYFCEQAPLSSL